MSIGTWTPQGEISAAATAPSLPDLAIYQAMGASDTLLAEIGQLEKTVINQLTPIMKQPLEFWQQVAGSLSREQVWHLMRFFTVAEEKHSQLFAGKDSSVIALNRILKQRQTPLSREELLWIRSNTTNRFLPNGSVL